VKQPSGWRERARLSAILAPRRSRGKTSAPRAIAALALDRRDRRK
jgi:hypothetical protein